VKRLILAVAIVFCWTLAARAAPPAALTTLRQITLLSNAQAAKGLPAAFEATVTYKVGYKLFVQDDGVGIYVWPLKGAVLVPGDRILIQGKTAGSFRPIVNSESISVLRHGDLPKPIPATYDELIRVQHDCVLVTIRGVVRAADGGDPRDGGHSAFLQMQTEGGYIIVLVSGDYTEDQLHELLDAEVEITGVSGGQFDGKMQIVGAILNVSSPAGIKILKRAAASPWSLPLTPMDLIITNHRVTGTQRVRVHGTITYYQPGSSAVLQDGAKSLWISTKTQDPLLVGDVVDATGFPDARNDFLALARGEILDSHIQAPIAPLATTRKELAQSHHIIDLVTVEGQVVSAARGATQDEYLLTTDGQIFTAIYRHPSANSAVLPPIKEIPIGAIVRVTGICITEDANPFPGEVAFDILMRSFDDITVVVRPSLLTVRNLMILVGLLLAVVFVVGARAWAIERRVRRQTAALAFIEQRRSRILEDINGSRPLAKLVEEITELVSFKLRGAPCWCQIVDGARLGNCPPKLDGLRVVQSEIPAHTGPPLGTIFATFDALAKPSGDEPEALSMAVALTGLAIETRRLYSDLVHRSEFDLLTDIHNRFSLDRYLDRQIEETRQNAGIFGLIYIDLDKFKQVNDIFGHQVGDLYLQDVALRMKRQLRGIDMLARLGGDEFAVLLPRVRNRAKVEEIALRLERSFDEPFTVEGRTLKGAASVGIALYSEDGASRDDLLSAADAAMYEVKKRKRQVEDSLAQNL
jgi:diguanylate cyclase (GGDEF)-like protein